MWELQAEVERHEATIRELRAEAAEQARLREVAEVEVVEQREDIAEQACDQAELETEVQSLELERDELRGSLARAKKDLVLIERKFGEAERHLADNEQLARKPVMIVAQKERKNRQLQKQLEAKAALIKAIREQLSQAQKSAHCIVSDVADEETRERLLQRLSSAQRAQAFSEEKCWQLEEDIADRDRALEEAELEAQKLAGRLDEQEEQRLLLDAKHRQRPDAEDEAAESKTFASSGGTWEDIATEWRERARQLEAQVCSADSQVRAATKAADSESYKRLCAMTTRCGKLEAAGKKLLTELDEKDRRLEIQGLALQVAQRQAAELQPVPGVRNSSSALGTLLHGSSGARPHTQSAAARVCAAPASSASSMAGRRVWVSGSGIDSGRESGRESGAEEKRFSIGSLPKRQQPLVSRGAWPNNPITLASGAELSRDMSVSVSRRWTESPKHEEGGSHYPNGGDRASHGDGPDSGGWHSDGNASENKEQEDSVDAARRPWTGKEPITTWGWRGSDATTRAGSASTRAFDWSFADAWQGGDASDWGWRDAGESAESVDPGWSGYSGSDRWGTYPQ